ncbi:2-oxo-4-hydroxy-4-carboxy-5-ureidoimidazoline decarboxylase [Streptomyces goshikiensis]|uniref:2-oxo-4-hydroxy-4-carboxy-5-ureidoimidazoline decarboxylase n=1 Tax=Streptomyces goshikiensis TaxID=1942 RepID=UPI0033295604
MAASVVLPLHTPPRGRPFSGSGAFTHASRHPFGSLPGENPIRVQHTRPRLDSLAAHPRRAPRSPPLSSHLPAQAPGSERGTPGAKPGGRSTVPGGAPGHGPGLTRFNALSHEDAHAILLHCCGSRRWAHRVATHRPYPDAASLLAAADEASYDLSQADLTEALSGEFPAQLGRGAPYAALLALDAAHAQYERTFGHAFVICLAGHPPEERADQLLGAIRRRMTHEIDEERAISADELRRLAQARLADLMDRLPRLLDRAAPGNGLFAADFGLFSPVG